MFDGMWDFSFPGTVLLVWDWTGLAILGVCCVALYVAGIACGRKIGNWPAVRK